MPTPMKKIEAPGSTRRRRWGGLIFIHRFEYFFQGGSRTLEAAGLCRRIIREK